MPSVLIVEKNASIKQHNIKSFAEDELYKKAGFKSKEGFSRHAVWNVEINNTAYSIELYGKLIGRAGQENKYDFPPPVDSALFFGACVLLQRRDNAVVDLTAKEWSTIYEELFGGFEDINEEDSDEESEEESLEDVPRTKNGYVKDGFVVDDYSEESEVSSEEEIRVVKKPSKPISVVKHHAVIHPEENIKMVLEIAKPAGRKVVGTPIEQISEECVVSTPVDSGDAYLGCTNELREEEYV